MSNNKLTNNSFEKFESTKKVDHVVNEILRQIKEGAYEAGDKLPPEQDLTEMLGVSRPVIREALAALRLANIIGTKAGVGTYVKEDNWEQDNFGLQLDLSSVFSGEKNLFEALETRRIIEPAIATYFLSSFDDNHLEVIRNSLTRMRAAATSSNIEEFHEMNKKFHLSIVNVSEISSLINYVSFLLDFFAKSKIGVALKEKYMASETYAQDSFRFHKAILDGLKKADKKKVTEGYSKHFAHLEEQLLGIGLENSSKS